MIDDKNDKLDDLYRNRFNDFELPVSDRLLANIKQELNIGKQKRRRGYWKWIIFSVLCFTGAAGFYFMNVNPKNNKKDISQVTKPVDSMIQTNTNIAPESKTENVENSTPEKTKNSLAKNDFKISEGAKEPVKTGSTEIKTSTKNPEQRIKNNENGSVKNKSKEKIKTKKLSPEPVKTGGSENVEKQLESASTGGKTNKQVSYSVAESIEQKNIPVSVKGNDLIADNLQKNEKSANENNPKPTANSADSASLTTSIEKNISTPENNTILENNTVKPLLDMPALQSDLMKIPAGINASDSVKLKTNTQNNSIKDTINFRKILFFMEINGGPSLSYRTLNPNTSTIAASRNTYEKNQETYNIGIDFGAIIKHKFIVNCGIGIDNKGEQYLFPGQAPLYNTTYVMVLDSGGQQSGIDTVLSQTQVALSANTSQNTYQFLRIPVLFGYRFTIKEKWFIAPCLGITFNYLIAAKSSWTDVQGNKIVYYNKSDNVFSSLSIAARIKVDLGMNITDHWSMSIQPAYTRFVQSIYRKEDKLKLYPYSYDLNVALRYTF